MNQFQDANILERQVEGWSAFLLAALMTSVMHFLYPVSAILGFAGSITASFAVLIRPQNGYLEVALGCAVAFRALFLALLTRVTCGFETAFSTGHYLIAALLMTWAAILIRRGADREKEHQYLVCMPTLSETPGAASKERGSDMTVPREIALIAAKDLEARAQSYGLDIRQKGIYPEVLLSCMAKEPLTRGGLQTRINEISVQFHDQSAALAAAGAKFVSLRLDEKGQIRVGLDAS